MNPETKKWVEDVKGRIVKAPDSHWHKAIKIIESQEKRIEELEKSLKFYADYKNFYADGCRGNDIFELHSETIGNPEWPQYHEREENIGWLAETILAKGRGE